MSDAAAVCPACGAELNLDAERCEYCGNRILPGFGGSSLSDGEGDILKRVANLQSAISKNPRDARVYYQLGQAQHQLADYSEAEESLKKSVELDPSIAEAFYLLAWNTGIRNGWTNKGVLEYAMKALAVNPKYAEAQALLHLCRGISCHFYDRSDTRQEVALKELSQAAEIDPKNTYAYLYAGYVCEANGDLDQAADWLQKAAGRARADIAPPVEDAKIFAHVGLIYARMGDFDAAKKFLEDAVKMDPANAAANELLSSISEG